MRDPSLIVGGRSRNDARGLTSPRSKLGVHVATVDYTKLPLGAPPPHMLFDITNDSLGIYPTQNLLTMPYDRGYLCWATQGASRQAILALPGWDWTEAQVECAYSGGANSSVGMQSGFVHTLNGDSHAAPVTGGAAVDSSTTPDTLRWYRQQTPGLPVYRPEELNKVITVPLRRYPGELLNKVGRNPRDTNNRHVRPGIRLQTATPSSGTPLFVFKIHLFRRERQSQ